MTKAAIIFTIILTMNTVVCSAQEPIVVSGYYAGKIPNGLEEKDERALFIQERARIAFYPNSTWWAMRLTEESAEKVGSEIIGIVYVNTAAHMLFPHDTKSMTFDRSESSWHPVITSLPDPTDELITREIFPVDADNPAAVRLSKEFNIPLLYFCKSYEDTKRQSWIDMYNGFERDIVRFFERPPVGDTISESIIHMLIDRTDSRYIPLLVKILTNDEEVVVKYVGHEHILPMPVLRRLPTGETEITYEGGGTEEVIHYDYLRISHIARRLLELYMNYSVDVWTSQPERGASAEEWQSWLDDLLKGTE